MNLPSQDIAEYLESSAGGSVGTIGTDIFVNEEPDSPDAALTIYDIPGESPDVNEDYERPYIAVRAREKRGNIQNAYTTLRAVRTAIQGLKYTVINDAYYFSIWQEGDISFVGTDDNRRHILMVEYRIHRRINA